LELKLVEEMDNKSYLPNQLNPLITIYTLNSASTAMLLFVHHG